MECGNTSHDLFCFGMKANEKMMIDLVIFVVVVVVVEVMPVPRQKQRKAAKMLNIYLNRQQDFIL